MSVSEGFTREEVLGGLPARQARTLLFLIESRTAHHVARSRQAMELLATEEATAERDLQFLEAFTLGRDPPLRPTIQDLESHAPQWAPLVPEKPRLRAALAHLVGQKYCFTHRAVPQLRAALGLDEDRVQQAYERLYRRPLESIFAGKTTLRERLTWSGAAVSQWLQGLPPFWLAFLLIFTLSFSQAFLGLPIAIAGIGAPAGLAFVLALGAVNVLTMACMAEAVARSGPVRYRKAFIGRLVSDTLGTPGASLLTGAVIVRFCLGLLAACFGLAVTLSDLTRVPSVIWPAAMFLLVLYVLSRPSLHFAANVMLLVGIVNVGLVVGLSLFALFHLNPAHLLLAAAPRAPGRFLDTSLLQPVCGMVLSVYFGHIYVSQSALLVLPRDPDGRALLRGSVLATLCMTALIGLWIVAVNGAVPPRSLAGQPGTALAPLAAQLGPAAVVLGGILVLLQLGLSTVRDSAVLFTFVRDRLPQRRRITLRLPRREGRLLFRIRSAGRDTEIGLTYRGLRNGRPQLRAERARGEERQSVEITLDAPGVMTPLAGLTGWDAPGLDLALAVQEATEEGVRLGIESGTVPRYEGKWEASGLGVADLLTLIPCVRSSIG